MSTKAVFLSGRSVNLRPVEKSDVPSITRWVNDPKIRDMVKLYLPTTEAEEEKWLESLEKGKPNNIVMAIETKDGKLIGVMGIHKISWRSRTATTGAIIGEKEYWGRGYGTEAKILLLHYAFYSLNLRKISSSVIAFNKRSEAYSLKCGYKHEGRFKKQIFRRGKYWDMIHLAIFEPNFRIVWKKYIRREIGNTRP